MPLVEVFVRGTVTFPALTVMIRIVSQREFGGLGITDLMVVVLVAEAANSASVIARRTLSSTARVWSRAQLRRVAVGVRLAAQEGPRDLALEIGFRALDGRHPTLVVALQRLDT